jgi:dolichyl-phosphate-mannose--protein O-mannosyl transferase
MQRREGRLLPTLILVASAASITASVVLAFYGIYFFFFFVPLAFGLPWSIKRLWRKKARKQWNIEDLR